MKFEDSHTINPGNSPIFSIDCSNDSQFLAIGQCSSYDGIPTLSIWDLTKNTQSKVIQKSQNDNYSVHKVVFCLNATHLIYTLQVDALYYLVLYNLSNDKETVLKKVEFLEEIIGFSINPVDNQLHLPIKGNEIEIWNLVDAALEKKVSVNLDLDPIDTDAYLSSAFSVDGKYLALSGFNRGSINILNAIDYKNLTELSASFSFPKCILLDSDKNLLVAVDFWLKGMFIWDINSGERHLDYIFDEYTLKVSCSAIYPKDKYIASGYSSSYAVVVDLETGEEVFKDKLHESRIYDIKITPDGKKLITAGEDWKIIIRNRIDE